MQLTIPDLSLVVLIGPSGAGKSTFAGRHFRATEVLSSDFCRGLVSDDENDQTATRDAFDVLHYIAGKRLAARRLAVVDATNVQPEARRPLVALARQYHCVPVAIVFDLPERLCRERNRGRSDRTLGPEVIHRQAEQMRRALPHLKREGFRRVFVLSSADEVEVATVVREPLRSDRRSERGPFDIIGDVHGCFDELLALLGALGYAVPDADAPAGAEAVPTHPQGRKAVFLGDLVDRGPATPAVLRLAMAMVEAGQALCVPGNHDMKLVRALNGAKVQVSHGLVASLEQLAGETPEFRARAAEFLDGLASHCVLDGGALVVAHAGMREELQGRASRKVRDFALYGETTGETDEFGLPVRYDWAADYRGRALVVYGHTPHPAAEWVNHTINIDTGCVFGGKLTALRYPEKALVQVPARRTYYEPARPMPAEPAPTTCAPRPGDVLDVDDVLGKRTISTRLYHDVTIREENANAALEVMSRFAVDPRWLIYLPPTMSPPEATAQPGLLEHPAEAFAYYRNQGMERVVCEAKHMGSRAIVVICRSEGAAQRRFGSAPGATGACYTRTGRPVFTDAALEAALLEQVGSAMERAGLWQELRTDWACLDCELMPWSAKAQALIEQQYAAVGATGRVALSAANAALQQGLSRGLEVQDLLSRFQARAEALERYTAAYERYCWPVRSLADLKLAPFHLLASEGAVHADKSHAWHMERLARLCGEGLLMPTPYRVVELPDPDSEAEATRWWVELTEAGGEGMVVKPFDFAVRGPRGLVQPAVKCRGREYLRIIYGPEYASPENLPGLHRRNLGLKRSLALREFALGIEGLERFVAREPFYRVHECVFGVLALESEPVDPRL